MTKALALPTMEEVDAELLRRHYLERPDEWIAERLKESTWSKQREIALSVAANRRTAVPSCYASGKSWLAARLACWWIDCHLPGEAFVVTTATSGYQVKAILWREMGRAHSSGKLRGRLNQTEWWLPMKDGREEMVAFGRKPDDMDPTAFQGIHARFVLVILDEAAGIPKALFEAADALITNDDSRMLAIGNPEDSASEFAEVCKPGSGWTVKRIPAQETPNFTGEKVSDRLRFELISQTWVEEKRRKWGEENPMWIAKVKAEFPESQDGGLIPISWVRAAQERTLAPGLPVELGVDVGGGGDRSVIAVRKGAVVRIPVEWRTQNPDTMQTCGAVIAAIRQTGASAAKVDEIGIGRGVVDRAKEQKHPVEGVNVGQAPQDTEAFTNLRAEGYWSLRERFQDGSIDLDPADDDLAAQLVDLKFKRTSNGKIQIESKDEIRRRGKPSPDDADAVMLAFLRPPREPEKPRGGTWGRR